MNAGGISWMSDSTSSPPGERLPREQRLALIFAHHPYQITGACHRQLLHLHDEGGQRRRRGATERRFARAAPVVQIHGVEDHGDARKSSRHHRHHRHCSIHARDDLNKEPGRRVGSARCERSPSLGTTVIPSSGELPEVMLVGGAAVVSKDADLVAQPSGCAGYRGPAANQRPRRGARGSTPT